MYDYRVYLEADQSVRSMKLPLYSCIQHRKQRGGGCVCVLLEPKDAEQTGGAVRESGPAVSSKGRALRPNVRKVHRADCVAFLATAVPSTTVQ